MRFKKSIQISLRLIQACRLFRSECHPDLFAELKDVQSIVDLAAQDPKNLESIRYWIDATSGSPQAFSADCRSSFLCIKLTIWIAPSQVGQRASSGSLTAMIGGNEEAFYAVKAVIQSFAKNLVILDQ